MPSLDGTYVSIIARLDDDALANQKSKVVAQLAADDGPRAPHEFIYHAVRTTLSS